MKKQFTMRSLLSALHFLLWTALTAQTGLLPHIGQVIPPQPTDVICEIPVYQGSMDQSGYMEDDQVPDFTLYTLSGDSVRLSDELAKGLPVLLVGANYTCPVWRGKINVLNAMAEYYKDQIKVYVVYTVEAHPMLDISPYSGQVWTTSTNEQDGVLYEQPETYGQRMAIVADMIADLNIVPPILIDGPCNEWWSHFGPAPNNAYLIRPDGTVAAKHGWFNRQPDNMWCDLDELLGTVSGECTTYGSNGIFSMKLDSGDSLAIGQPGDILSVHCTLENLSMTDNAHILIKKAKVEIPKSWQTALCADICYAADVEETEITIPPASSQPFIFYFYTDLVADTGFARVQFVNTFNQQNRMAQRFFGITGSTSATDPGTVSPPILFPIPASDFLRINWPGASSAIQWALTDQTGRILQQGMATGVQSEIDIQRIPPGTCVWSGRIVETGQVFRQLIIKY